MWRLFPAGLWGWGEQTGMPIKGARAKARTKESLWIEALGQQRAEAMEEGDVIDANRLWMQIVDLRSLENQKKELINQLFETEEKGQLPDADINEIEKQVTSLSNELAYIQGEINSFDPSPAPATPYTQQSSFQEPAHSFWAAIQTPEDLWALTTNELAHDTIFNIINDCHEIISLDLLKEALKSPQQKGQALLNSLGGFMKFYPNPKDPLDLQHCIYRDSKPENPDYEANYNKDRMSAAAQYATWNQYSPIQNIVMLLKKAPTLVEKIAQLERAETLTLESALEEINKFNPMTTAPIRITENTHIPSLVEDMLKQKANYAKRNSNDEARNLAKASDDALNIFKAFALFMKK